MIINNMKNKKIFYQIFVCAVSFVISFVTTWYCRGHLQKSNVEDIDPVSSEEMTMDVPNRPNKGNTNVGGKSKDTIHVVIPSQTEIKEPARPQEPQKQEVPSKMSKDEFERRLRNNGDNNILGGKDARIAKNVRIQVIGMSEDENIPTDMQEVREKVNFGTWTSFRVVSVSYDSEGRISAAVIQAVY